MTPKLPSIALVTGFPDHYLATRVVQRLLEVDRSLRLRCIVRESQLERANAFVARLSFQQRERLRLLVGDAAALDLGLSGKELGRLTAEVELIHHCASTTDLAGTKSQAAATVTAAREILELADDCANLQRLVHWSSTTVSGAREGLVMEEDLSDAHGFRSLTEKALFQAEAMMRESKKDLPITVLRHASLVGDSVTGETDLLHGPYLLIRLLLNSPEDLRIPTPMRRDVRLSFVPIDYAVNAGVHISQDSRAVGRTFHIVDPKPLTLHRAFELFAEATGRPMPKGYLPTVLATALMRTPGLDRWVHTPRAFLENVRTAVIYDDRQARELLDGSNLQCPALEDYVEVMVAYVRGVQEASQRRRGRAAQPRV